MLEQSIVEQTLALCREQKEENQDYNLLQGDSLEVLKTLPDCSVNTCVTSPPYYGLRSYLPGKVKLKDDAPQWVKNELNYLNIKPL